MAFLTSPNGVAFMEQAGVALQAIADSPAVQRFVATLTAANTVGSESPCFEESNWAMLTSLTILSTVDILKAFFLYMTKRVMNP